MPKFKNVQCKWISCCAHNYIQRMNVCTICAGLHMKLWEEHFMNNHMDGKILWNRNDSDFNLMASAICIYNNYAYTMYVFVHHSSDSMINNKILKLCDYSSVLSSKYSIYSIEIASSQMIPHRCAYHIALYSPFHITICATIKIDLCYNANIWIPPTSYVSI